MTDEYVDVKSRLNTKKEVHQKYVQLMRNKAKSIDEVIKAEEAIRHIQEEIEAREGRLRYLANKSSMSTIDLSVYSKINPQPLSTAKAPYLTALIGKLKNGFWNGIQIIEVVVLILLNFWPILILGTLFYWRRSVILNKVRKSGVEV